MRNALVVWSVAVAVMTFIGCKSESKRSVTHSPKENKEITQTVKPVSPKYASLHTIDFITGRFDPKSHPDFVPIPAKYTDKSGIYLHKDCLQAYLKMYEAAANDGIKLTIRSAARNFNYQRSIWEAKWNGTRKLSNGKNAKTDIPNPVQRAKEIMMYSAMPGASRHHWGTDIDLNAFDNSYFESGKGKQIYDWLKANGPKYGFVQVYTSKGTDRNTGYEEEKWHWSYKPISKGLTEYAKANMTDSLLQNFSGAETAADLQVVRDYILGISRQCF